jgi:hypothetical protein
MEKSGNGANGQAGFAHGTQELIGFYDHITR